MPQKLLHRADAVACFKQVGGPASRGINSGVAQDMPTYFLADTDPTQRPATSNIWSYSTAMIIDGINISHQTQL